MITNMLQIYNEYIVPGPVYILSSLPRARCDHVELINDKVSPQHTV